jgi:hypothetical protein
MPHRVRVACTERQTLQVINAVAVNRAPVLPFKPRPVALMIAHAVSLLATASHRSRLGPSLERPPRQRRSSHHQRLRDAPKKRTEKDRTLRAFPARGREALRHGKEAPACLYVAKNSSPQKIGLLLKGPVSRSATTYQRNNRICKVEN